MPRSKATPLTTDNSLRIGLVVPHIFMQRDILPHVIFSPGQLALDLAEGLAKLGVAVTLFTPGPVDTTVSNIIADLSYFDAELDRRGYDYLSLLKKHPLTFISLARQVQAELIAAAYARANDDEFDIIHVYTNEEELALPMSDLCQRPVVFTHHDPFNLLVKYKSVMAKYAHKNWLAVSDAQRAGMPTDTNWLATIYHGLQTDRFQPLLKPTLDYVAFYGRLIEPKGAHLAIAAVRTYNLRHPDTPIQLKLAGQHYSGKKDDYWQTHILPELDDTVEYIGFLRDDSQRQTFLGNARALLVPSTFNEPFGMVAIEALACGTPVIGTAVGAIPEVITDAQSGFVVPVHSYRKDAKTVIEEEPTVAGLVIALENIAAIDRQTARHEFESRFTLERMCQQHLAAYQQLIK